MPQIGLLIDWTQLEETIPELEDISIETSKTEMQREPREKSRTEYPRTAGQLQKLYHTYNGNPTSRREREEMNGVTVRKGRNQLFCPCCGPGCLRGHRWY